MKPEASQTTAMLAQTRLKLKNAETSIAFLQEQHAKTLEGLHKEIEQLQKKNARLTFDLAMIAPPGSADSTKCKGCQQYEEELVTSKSEMLRLSSALSTEKGNCALLQHQLKELISKYSAELNSKDETLQRLVDDLERKSNAVALITQQYHQLRARFHQELDSLAQANSRCSHCYHHESTTTDEASPQDTTDTQRAQYSLRGLRLAPNPPSGISRRTPTSIRRRNFHRSTSSPVPCDISSMTNIDCTESTHAQPTPPSTPKPLLYSSSPPQLRRASRPIRRQMMSSATSLSEHPKRVSMHNSEASRSKATSPLEPVRRQKSGVIPLEISDIIQSSKNSKHEHAGPRQPPPVLPPIEPSKQLDSVSNQAFLLSSTNSKTTSPSNSRKQHRHLILSKAQGLSSAPVRPMRVMCYSQARLDTVDAQHVEEEVTKEGLEGVLLVNEMEDSAWTEVHQQGTDS